jgi:hypothetical protein
VTSVDGLTLVVEPHAQAETPSEQGGT